MVLKSLYQPFYFMADCLFPLGDLWFRAKTMYLSKNWKNARQVSIWKPQEGYRIQKPLFAFVNNPSSYNLQLSEQDYQSSIRSTLYCTHITCSMLNLVMAVPPQFNLGTQYSTWRTFLFCDFSRKWSSKPWGSVLWFYCWPFSWCWMLTQPWLEARKQFNLAWPCNHIMELTLSSGMYGSALHLLTKN